MKRVIAALALCGGLALGVPGASAGESDARGGKSEVAKACAELKQADKAAFKATYGKHSMRSCKKGEKPAADETSPGEFKNAAKECRAEREADPAFGETYETNANKKNAFGKCVSTKVREGEETPPE